MVVSLQPCVLIACATYTATSADRDMQVRAFNPAATGGPQRPSTRGSRVLMSDYLRPCGYGADLCRGNALEHYRPDARKEAHRFVAASNDKVISSAAKESD